MEDKKMKEAKITELYDLKETIAAKLFEEAEYPWELLPKIHDFIIELGKSCPRIFMRKKVRISGWRKAQR